jgi:hypothetical protein
MSIILVLWYFFSLWYWQNHVSAHLLKIWSRLEKENIHSQTHQICNKNKSQTFSKQVQCSLYKCSIFVTANRQTDKYTLIILPPLMTKCIYRTSLLSNTQWIKMTDNMKIRSVILVKYYILWKIVQIKIYLFDEC